MSRWKLVLGGLVIAAAASLATAHQLRDERAAATRTAAPAVATVTPAAPRSPAGTALLARARAAKTWTAADRDELRRLVPRLSAPDREQLLRGVAMALNRRELVLDGIKTPF